MAVETAQGLVKLIIYVAVLRDDAILLVQYRTPPNPKHSGWWLPAPELEYGEHPQEGVARVLGQLGLGAMPAELVEVESFTAPSGWHLIFHYTVRVAGEAAPEESIAEVGWFRAEQMPAAGEFAHGNWERALALRRLGPAEA